MNRSLLALAITATFGTVSANSFTGFDAQSSGMGHTGVAASAAANASYFNPALLSAYQGDVRFAMTLPSVQAYIDDSTGLIKDLSAFADDGGTIDQFESIDIERVDVAINGSATEDSMATVLANIQANIQEISNISGSYDSSQQAALEAESAELTQNTQILNDKTTIASDESNNIQNVATGTRSDVLDLDERALSMGLGGTALEIALPREGLAMGLHLRTNVSVGAQLFIEENDFTVVDDAIAELQEITGAADDFSASMVVVSERNEALTQWIGEAPEDGASVAEVQAWQEGLEDRVEALDEAQQDADQKLTALENAGADSFEVGEFNQDDFTSELEVVGANITEFGVTVAREFTYMDEEFSVGITPKLLNIMVFERRFSVNDEFDDLTTVIEENTTSYFRPNIDVGVAKQWDELWYGDVRVGLTVKDLIPYNLDTETGNTLEMRPKVRIGGAHLTRWTTVAADLDITENQPLRYGVPTRYLGLGAEFNAYDWLKLRAGYRNNLSVSGAHAITTGIGLTPWGVGLDLGAWFTPASFDDWEELVRDAGVTAQFSMQF
ncbi:MAG: conjugal transfer protein TraF [Saccharospirillum sp.]